VHRVADELLTDEDQRMEFGAMHPGRVDVIGGGALIVTVLAEELAKRPDHRARGQRAHIWTGSALAALTRFSDGRSTLGSRRSLVVSEQTSAQRPRRSSSVQPLVPAHLFCTCCRSSVCSGGRVLTERFDWRALGALAASAVHRRTFSAPDDNERAYLLALLAMSVR